MEKWILEDNCKVIAILGLAGVGKTGVSVKLTQGGIGKTDLSLKLANGIQDAFDYVIWRTLRNAPPLVEILEDVIKFLSDQQEVSLPSKIDAQISRLCYYLQYKRCLLILDNFETILKSGEHAGQCQDCYKDYGLLLTQIGETKHKSCLLITSREKPQEVARLEGATKPVRTLLLEGLPEEHGRQIFTEISDAFSGSNKDWKDVIEFYDGNPLALDLAAKYIKDEYACDISLFLQKEDNKIIDDINDLLAWHFNRLSPAEKEIMYWLAIEREPVMISNLKEDILSSIAQKSLVNTLQLLERRIRLEKSAGNKFSLQPVLIEYTTERFIEQIGEEIQVSSPILLDYIRERLIKQVTEELRQGKVELFNNYCIFKALAKNYVRDSQARLILEPLWDRLIAIFGTQAILEDHLKRLLAAVRTKTPLYPGYLAGNILALLCHMKVDVSGYDFSALELRQAYLQGFTVQNVNFSRAHFVNTLFTQYFSSILVVGFSADGTLLATGDANAEVRLWQVADGKQLRIFKGHTAWLRSVLFHPGNPDWLVTASEDQTIRIWDINTGRCVKILNEHTNRIRSLAFSRDGHTLVSGADDCTVKIWDMDSGTCITTLHGHQQFVLAVALSPDGKIIASAGDEPEIRLWSAETGECFERPLSGHADSVLALAFSPDGRLLASACEDKTIILWDVRTCERVDTLKGHSNWVWSVAFHPHNQILASSSADHTIRFWDIASGQCTDTLTGHTSWIRSLTFSADGDLLASGSDDQTLKIWDVSDRKCLKTLRGYTSWIWRVVFSPDGKHLASDNGDKVVRIWCVSDGDCLKTLRGHAGVVQSVVYSPDGKQIVTGSDDQTMKVWDIEREICTKTIGESEGLVNAVRSLSFHPTEKIVASAGTDHYVRLWNLDKGECIKLEGHNPCNWVWSVAFSPIQPNRLLSSGDDQTAILWDLDTDFRGGKPLKTFTGHTNSVRSVAFGHQGKRVATGSEDTTVRVWDVDTGECLRILTGHDNWIWSVAFNYDDTLAASGSNDQSVKIWDIASGECIHTLTGHSNKVRCVAFSPTEPILASGSEDGTIRLWNIKTGEVLHEIIAPRPYEGMDITGVTGLSDAQKEALMLLGAVQHSFTIP